MNAVFYIIIFILGAVLGSFYATIIKRMWKNKNVFSIHSYCSDCGKKLSFFEKIPVLSYIFLRGKCRHCDKKIESTYIILELITGILFLITVYSLKLDIIDINITDFISFIFIGLYYTYIILTIGTELKSKRISQPVLAFGIIISIIYMIYLWWTKSTTIYINVIYLLLVIGLLLLNIINTKKRAEGSYVLDLLTMLLVMLIFTTEFICVITINGTLLAIAFYILIKQIKNRHSKIRYKFNSNVRIAFIMGTLNILSFLALINV